MHTGLHHGCFGQLRIQMSSISLGKSNLYEFIMALEAALHRAFENKRVNMVNQRREFFHVTLDEIKEVVRKNYDKTVEFIDVPDAEQYRVSRKKWEEAS